MCDATSEVSFHFFTWLSISGNTSVETLIKTSVGNFCKDFRLSVETLVKTSVKAIVCYRIT